MKSLFHLVKKNLTLLVRERSSALIVFFAPLLIILILGLSFNSTSEYGLTIGVHASSITDDVKSVISSLEEQEFNVVEYTKSADECVDDIKQGKIHTCVSLPTKLSVDNNEPREVTFYLDESNINLAWMVQRTLESKFNLKSQEISQALTNDLLSRVENTKKVLGEQGKKVSDLQSKNSQASSTASSMKDSLSKVDLKVTLGNHDKAKVTTFQNNIASQIQSSQKAVEDAFDAVDATNITGVQKDSIQKELKKIRARLTTANDLVKTNSSVTNGILLVTELIDGLQHDLHMTVTKLDAAAKGVQDASTNLGSSSSTLKESADALAAINSKLNDVKKNLQAQKVTDAGTLSAPLVSKIERVSEQGTYLNYIFPLLLVLVVMFTSLLLGTTLVMMEKNSQAFFRNYFVPIKKSMFVASIYITTIILILIQIVVILAVALFFLKGSLLVSIPWALLVLFLAGSVFSFIGMAIGYVFKSEETGILASISLGSLFLFVSGAILPIETSKLLSSIAQINPFVISQNLLRKLVLFKSSIGTVWEDLLILVAYTIVLFLVILIIENVLHKHYISRSVKKHHRIHLPKFKRKQKKLKEFEK